MMAQVKDFSEMSPLIIQLEGKARWFMMEALKVQKIKQHSMKQMDIIEFKYTEVLKDGVCMSIEMCMIY